MNSEERALFSFFCHLERSREISYCFPALASLASSERCLDFARHDKNKSAAGLAITTLWITL